MMNGWTRLSNCAASTMYMKIDARPIASSMFVVVSSRIFTWPEKTHASSPAAVPPARCTSCVACGGFAERVSLRDIAVDADARIAGCSGRCGSVPGRARACAIESSRIRPCLAEGTSSRLSAFGSSRCSGSQPHGDRDIAPTLL